MLGVARRNWRPACGPPTLLADPRFSRPTRSRGAGRRTSRKRHHKKIVERVLGPWPPMMMSDRRASSRIGRGPHPATCSAALGPDRPPAATYRSLVPAYPARFLMTPPGFAAPFFWPEWAGFLRLGIPESRGRRSALRAGRGDGLFPRKAPGPVPGGPGPVPPDRGGGRWSRPRAPRGRPAPGLRLCSRAVWRAAWRPGPYLPRRPPAAGWSPSSDRTGPRAPLLEAGELQEVGQALTLVPDLARLPPGPATRGPAWTTRPAARNRSCLAAAEIARSGIAEAVRTCSTGVTAFRKRHHFGRGRPKSRHFGRPSTRCRRNMAIRGLRGRLPRRPCSRRPPTFARRTGTPTPSTRAIRPGLCRPAARLPVPGGPPDKPSRTSGAHRVFTQEQTSAHWFAPPAPKGFHPFP